ncbi:hypothetical protein GOARA_008_00040 [Gordonia araii NBRC 100433]|uniref:Uncharacterized protein n=1 Tax=Gordonia araii NBRC 100433 TaxID=1073574 RepID=G7GXH9_9ACTN|nr:hypothetical protein [Gordonia araii]NNG98255.1 hypothetical protein [Gordonia araii NBRC 100433]GAB08304.1 hypothetical protein GOARA_008_00040 [Gordonia araii NBRC 100433]
MRKIVSAIAAVAAVTGMAFIATPAEAAPRPTVQFAVDGHRLVGTATGLPEGRKSCGFNRSNPDPGPIIGSFGNDMIVVGNRLTRRDKVTITSRPVPPGRYLLRMSCFIKNRKSGMYDIVAVNEEWIRVTRAPQHHRPRPPATGRAA